MASGYTIWHNPKCSTSRFVLEALRAGGIAPVVRDYQRDPPSTEELGTALKLMGMSPRDLIRRKGTTLYDDLGLADPALSDAALIAAMAEHPILIERPVVFSPDGARVMRPKEMVFDLLPGGTPA